jgi:nucleoside-diphosphate-sugar epimerase
MHVLVVGGTGFIGYHIVQELLAQHHDVTVLSRNPEKAKKTFGDTVDYQQGDLSFFREISFASIFANVDVLIYAAGVDERQTPKGEPYAFFYQENVTTCVNMLEKAKEFGVKKAIVLGSIFSYINELHPNLELYQHHPYIRSRVEQKKQSLALADIAFIVNIVEIPFVFGYTAGQSSLWKTLVNYIRIANPLVVTPGGANAISVNNVGKATVNIIHAITESGGVPIGDENLTWVQMLERINKAANGKSKTITLLKRGLFTDLTRMGAFFQEFIGISSGLDHKYISKLINLEAFFDTTEIKKQLDYEGGDLDQAFEDTIKACPSNVWVDNLQRSMNWISDSTLQTLKRIDKTSNNKK